MIEKVEYRTIVEVLSVIGWGAGLIIILRTALRYLVRWNKAETAEDKNLAAAINGALISQLAQYYKEQTELYHELATKLAVLESRLEAEIKSRRT